MINRMNGISFLHHVNHVNPVYFLYYRSDKLKFVGHLHPIAILACRQRSIATANTINAPIMIS